MKKITFLVAMALLLAGCGRAAFMAANIPVLLSPHRVMRDISYGPQDYQTLDIHVPARAGDAPLDVIVFFYGGRWTTGKKEDYSFVGERFTSENFITVIPDYSKYPAVRFPVFVEDGAKAVAWVHDHIAEYGGNVGRIHIMGHSAGAHIGALLTADKKYLKAMGKNPNAVIHDFVGLAGPYDFTPDVPDLIDMFPKPYAQMQVPTFIDGHEPPMLLLWGDADKDVGRFNLEKLDRAINTKHGKVHSIIYPSLDHIDMIKELTWIGGKQSPIFHDILQFIKQNKP